MVQKATIKIGFSHVVEWGVVWVEGVAGGNSGDCGGGNGDWILREMIGRGEDSFINILRLLRVLRS